MEENVTSPCTMVDRIVPAATSNLTGIADQLAFMTRAPLPV
ncbi:hypothetical protein ACLK19_29185 [Escherichia coli]